MRMDVRFFSFELESGVIFVGADYDIFLSVLVALVVILIEWSGILVSGSHSFALSGVLLVVWIALLVCLFAFRFALVVHCSCCFVFVAVALGLVAQNSNSYFK